MQNNPLVGQVVQQRVAEGPYEAGPPVLSGTLKFPCCGENWVVTSDRITHVKCPDCGNLYVLALKFSVNPPTPQPFSKGTWLEVTKPFTVKVGARDHTTKVGDKLRVGMDAYGVFSVTPDGIILEFEVSGRGGNRILLAAGPLSHLKVVEESNVKVENPNRTDKNSPTDQGKEHL